MRKLSGFLLIGTAAIALSACSSSKGPGELGSQDDIVVKNMNMPGQMAADDSMEPMPAPEVESEEVAAMDEGFEVSDGTEVVEPATEDTSITEGTAPMSTTAAPPPADISGPVGEQAPQVPQEPVVSKAVPDEYEAPVEADVSAEAEVDMPATASTSAPADAAPTEAQKMMQSSWQEPPASATTAPSPALEPYISDTTESAVSAAPTMSDERITPPVIMADDPDVIKAVQMKLKELEYYFGPVSGEMGADTLNAVTKYQAAKGLEMGGLSHETLVSLGIAQ